MRTKFFKFFGLSLILSLGLMSCKDQTAPYPTLTVNGVSMSTDTPLQPGDTLSVGDDININVTITEDKSMFEATLLIHELIGGSLPSEDKLLEQEWTQVNELNEDFVLTIPATYPAGDSIQPGDLLEVYLYTSNEDGYDSWISYPIRIQ